MLQRKLIRIAGTVKYTQYLGAGNTIGLITDWPWRDWIVDTLLHKYGGSNHLVYLLVPGHLGVGIGL